MVFLSLLRTVSAQVGVDYDLKKPEKWENRTLASETSNNGKKFKKFRHFVQNNITHYNFYFNANEKMKTIVARAKASFKDDYTKLLPFYNYTLDATSAQKKDLDSIVYRCTMGILIHDTRNDWIDNLYLLMGESYFYKKFYDSAYITFQFINWAFAPKEKDGYFIPIGSNYNKDEGGNADKVSTPEKRKTLEKAFDLPAPSRNDALVWKVRTYLAQNRYVEAAALMEVLDHDPQFPARLRPSLSEMRSLYYYQQQIYDSTAFFLIRALPAAGTHEEMARWEYLIAQCFERTNNSYEAKTFYERCYSHTYDPVLDIYARLNAIRQNKEGGADYIDKNIQVLVKMARKDRFEAYKDIIYYTAAQMELERRDTSGALAFLQQCVRNSPPNGTQKTKAFLQLGNLEFASRQYRLAKSSYDSLNMIELASQGDYSWLIDRKAALTTIVGQLQVMERQDSLQRIAALPLAQRDAYLKKLARYLRRQQGLKDEGEDETGVALNSQNKAIPDMFASSSNTNAASWYFNNPDLKARGYSDFKNRWGNRQNVDNWAVTSMVRNNLAANSRSNIGINPDSTIRLGVKPAIDYKSLLAGLPLTPEKMKKSNDSIEASLFLLGYTYQDGIQDYLYAVNSYDTLLAKFPDTKQEEHALLNLYYCYLKLGDQANADRILGLMRQKFPTGSFTARALNPDSVANAATSLKNNATNQYEKIYENFIEGRFDEAIAQKRVADSLYGDKYWTPQLLYIESIYFIRSYRDPEAKAVLQNIVGKFPHTPMADKATTMLDVLSRRRQIEDYLTKLQIRKAEDTAEVVNAEAAVRPQDNRPRMVRNDSNLLKTDSTSDWAKAKAREVALAKDTGVTKGVVATGKIGVDSGNLRKVASSDSAIAAAKLRNANSAFTFTPDAPHAVVLVMTKVDPVYVNEARNAFNGYNQENFYARQLIAENASINDSVKILVIRNFATDKEAMTYLASMKALAPRQIVPWLPAGKYAFILASMPESSIVAE